MTAFDSVDALVHALHEAAHPTQGEWRTHGRFNAYYDEASDLVHFIMLNGEDDAAVERIPDHPALHRFGVDFVQLIANIALASWVLDDGALDAVLAAEVDPEYARAAHRAGVTDAWQLIEAWENSIPVEFLSALGGAA